MPKPKPTAKGRTPKRVLLVDDHPMMRRGLASLIENEPDLVVCGEADNCQAALKAIQESRPDLVIIDLSLKDSDGLDLVKDMKLRHPKTPALVLSMHDESLYAERAFRAGARGYVAKHEMDETMLAAIRRVLAGERHMSERMRARFADRFLGRGSLEQCSPLAVLSDRELQVFKLIGGGQTTREIAAALHLSIKTIESYREHLKAKLNLESGVALARRAAHWVETGQATQ
jgi:DNA-binding NarL/FixJ family response regulator